MSVKCTIEKSYAEGSAKPLGSPGSMSSANGSSPVTMTWTFCRSMYFGSTTAVRAVLPSGAPRELVSRSQALSLVFQTRNDASRSGSIEPSQRRTGASA
ncbi:hypothetical protein [Nonomuraea rubra]|uniref:hypothetical protein n=1 Tax=Nonomuraea rubra TaxID=46180 RepID=UPI0031E615DF